MLASTICPPHGQIAQTFEVGVEPGKQGIDGLGTHQGLAEPPDRRLVGRVIAIVEAEEAPKAAPVENLELGLRIRQAVERLQDQRLEHHHRVQRWAATLAAVRSLQGRIQRGTKYLKVDQHPEFLQRIARRRKRRIPLVQIEKKPGCTDTYASIAQRDGITFTPLPPEVNQGVRLAALPRSLHA